MDQQLQSRHQPDVSECLRDILEEHAYQIPTVPACMHDMAHSHSY